MPIANKSNPSKGKSDFKCMMMMNDHVVDPTCAMKNTAEKQEKIFKVKTLIASHTNIRGLVGKMCAIKTTLCDYCDCNNSIRNIFESADNW